MGRTGSDGVSAFRAIVLLAGVAFASAGCAGPGASPELSALGATGGSDIEHQAATLRLARAARNAGDLVSAVTLYRGLTAGKTVDSTVLVELGDALADLGLLDEAGQAYERVPSNAQARTGALLGLLQLQLTLGQPARALYYGDEALARAPDAPSVLVGRGVALDLLERHDEAQQSYRDALVIARDDAAARNDLALSLALSAKFDEAIQILSPLALSANATPQLRQNLALIYGLEGDRDRASQLSRLDLDEEAARANQALFDRLREVSGDNGA